MSVSTIIDQALARARKTAGGSEKTASSGSDLVKEAHQLADALEYVALTSADDGTAAGAVRRTVVEDFFKRANSVKSAADHPAESVAPTGTQKDVPAAGAKKILPVGLAGGKSPEESGAPTGTQATVDQVGTKKADQPMTLLDMLTQKHGEGPSNSPVQSVAGQDAAAPPTKNENANVSRILDSSAGVVSATKRDAKAPTRARLKALFASASDTGPSSAAAQAAFPTAYARGGMKVAEAEKEAKKDYTKEEPTVGRHLGKGAIIGGGVGAGLGAGAGAAGAHLGQKLKEHLTSADPIGARGEHALHSLADAVGEARLSPESMSSLRTTLNEVGHAVPTISKTRGALQGALGHGLTGAAIGTGIGALGYAAHRRKYNKAHEGGNKKASVADLAAYAQLYEKMASGELGDEAKAFTGYIEQVDLA